MDLFNRDPWCSDRLVMRPFLESDAETAMRLFVPDPEVVRFVSWKPLRDQAAALGFARREEQAWIGEEDCRSWLAHSKATADLVGSLAVRLDGDEVSFSYVVRRGLWGRGYATEMVAALLDRCRKDPSLRAARAVCDEENLASKRVLEKAGLVLDQKLHGHARHGPTRELRDCLSFGADVGNPCKGGASGIEFLPNRDTSEG